MRALLDTHTVIWAAVLQNKLSRAATKLIADESVEMLISSASVWEIATKVRLGKLRIAEEREADLLDAAKQSGYRILSITPEVALRAGRLAGDHGDPFDRMIAAHALAEDIPVISADTKLDEFGVRRIW
jgi:PIN domain nuclease of toxin-antitoxin system